MLRHPPTPAGHGGFARLARLLPLRCRRGAPAIEFLLVCPILVCLLLGSTDLFGAMLTLRRLSLAAQEVAEAAATMAATPTAMGVITVTQANLALSIASANFPQWLGTSNPGYGVTLSSIAMVVSPANCNSNCTYVPGTAWSLAINGGQPVLRACGTVKTVANSVAPTLTALPVGLLYPPGILVADVSTIYQPYFTQSVIGNLTMSRSAYIPPRAVGPSYITLSLDGSGYTGYKCNGYP